MGKEFTNLTVEDLCDLMCGGPEEGDGMTREEAISCLNLIDFINGQCTLATWWRGIDDEMRSAIEMAIEALSAEPCEDAISRQEAIDAIESTPFEDYGDYMNVRELIEQLPSVTPTCSEKPNNCTACILDGTDACSRGAGRAVDGRVCEDFVGESEE